MSTTETERYVRITLLTFEGGIWISKKILYREIDRTPGSPTIDALLLSKKQQLTQKRNRREITKRQYETLFPVSGADTEIDEWDLSLLIKIVLFLFEYSLSGQEIYDLGEILRTRNEVVCHAKHPSVKEHEFNMHWTQLTLGVSSLASVFDISTKKYASDLVQKLSRGPLDLQSSIERVAQLCRNDEHMEHVLASLSTLQRRLNEVATGVVDANRKLDDVLAGVRELIRIHETDEEGQCRVEIPIMNSTVVLTGKKEDVVKLAENVLRKVLQSAIDKVEDQNDDEKIRDAVQTFLDDIESNGGTADSTESGSIILKIRCETLNGLDSMLSFFRVNGHRYRCVGIENALSAMFQEELKVELVLPDDTLDRMKMWADKCLSALSDPTSEDEVQEYKRGINLGIKCDSAEAALDVIKYLQSDESANRLNQIAEAVSAVVGDKIKIEARPDVEGFSRALRANILSAESESGIGETSVEYEPPQIEINSQAPKETSSPSLLPQLDSPVMESHETTTVSDEGSYKTVLAECYVKILVDLDPDPLLDQLVETNIIPAITVRDLQEERFRVEKNRSILDRVRTSGPEGYLKFLQMLKTSGNEDVYHMLKEKEEEIAKRGFGPQSIPPPSQGEIEFPYQQLEDEESTKSGTTSKDVREKLNKPIEISEASFAGEDNSSFDSCYGSNDSERDKTKSLQSLDDEIKNIWKELPPHLKAPFIDVLVLYSANDRGEAEKFRVHLVDDIKIPSGEKMRALLYECPEFTSLSRSQFQNFDLAVERSTYVFVYLTKSFVECNWCEISSESCLMKAIYDDEKRRCVVPVYTQKRSSCNFKIPKGLNSLKGINYYNNDEFYRNGVARLVGDKITVKDRLAKVLKIKQKEWIEKYKREQEEIKNEQLKKKLAEEEMLCPATISSNDFFSETTGDKIVSVAPPSQVKKYAAENERVTQPRAERVSVSSQPLEQQQETTVMLQTKRETSFFEDRTENDNRQTSEALFSAFLHQRIDKDQSGEMDNYQNFPMVASAQRTLSRTDYEEQVDRVARRLRNIGEGLSAIDPVEIPPGADSWVLMDSLHHLEHQLLDSLIWLDDNSDVLVSAAKVLQNGKTCDKKLNRPRLDMSTIDTERYVRITLLTFKGGMWISRKVLLNQLDKTCRSLTLDALLHSNKEELTKKKTRREITVRQYEAMFPKSGIDTDIEEWDLSLLIKVIRFLFDHSMPGQDNYNLSEILRIRNEVVCHGSNTEIKEGDFIAHRDHLEICLCSLARTIDPDTERHMSDMVQSLSTGPLDLQSARTIIAQHCRFDELDKKLTALENKSDIYEVRLADLETAVKNLKRSRTSEDGEGQNRIKVPMLSTVVYVSGEDQTAVNKASDTLFEHYQHKADNDDNEEDPYNKNVRQAVKKFNAELESRGAVIESAEKGSVILHIRCDNLGGLENVLSLFRAYSGRYRLKGIESALNAVLHDAVTVEWRLPDSTIEMLKRWLENMTQEYQSSINLGIKCVTAEAAVDVMRYLQSSDSTDRLNRVAEALSDVVGDKVKVKVVPDVDGFAQALRQNEDVQSQTSTMPRDTAERRMAQGVTTTPIPDADTRRGHETVEDSTSSKMAPFEDGTTSTSQALVASRAEQAAVKRVRLLKTVLDAGVLINIHRWWIGEISGKRAMSNILELGLAVAGGITVGAGGAAGGGAVGAAFGPIGAFISFVAGYYLGYYAGYVSGNALADLLLRAIFDLPQSEASEKAYAFMGVSHHASNADVNSAFRRLGLRYHPDKGGKKEDWTRLQYYMAVIREERGEGETG